VKLDIAAIIKEFSISPSEYILLHVGASTCQEASYYDDFNFNKILWVEALPEVADEARLILKSFPKQELVQGLCFSESGVKFQMHTSNNGKESSSILKPYRHLDIHSNVKFINQDKSIVSTTIDEIMKRETPETNIILVLDVQGAELSVLEGGIRTLSKANFVFSEVSTIKLYKGQALFCSIVRRLKALGFELFSHDISLKTAYGDALFVRNIGSQIRSRDFSTSFLFGALSLLYHSKFFCFMRRVINKLNYLVHEVNPIGRKNQDYK